MKNNIEPQKRVNCAFGYADLCIVLFLLVLYFCSVNFYGLKFAAGTVISWLTGGIIWFVRLILQPGDDAEGVGKPFCWFLFLLFPLFIPLAMPLWLIPVILIICYWLSVSAFGGHGNHIFNPVIFAVVFMLYGYADSGITSPSRPFAEGTKGYKIWTAGVPPRQDIREIYSEITNTIAIRAAYSAVLPSMPGSCFSGIILLASFIFSVIFKRRIIWYLISVGSICSFSMIVPQPAGYGILPLTVLLLGTIPALLLCGIADYISIPKSIKGQAIYGVTFGFFAVLMSFYSSEMLAPAYGYLISQVISPLVLDVLGIEA